jgi:hypothetical protein
MKNETRIRENLSKSLHVKTDKATFYHLTESIKTSVDFKLDIRDVNFLFEVDSNNVVKIIIGQYVLLNKAKNLPPNPFFIVIHCYKKYNVERTIKHLNYAREAFACTIPFAVLTENEWIKNTHNKSQTELEDYLISLAKTNISGDQNPL